MPMLSHFRPVALPFARRFCTSSIPNPSMLRRLGAATRRLITKKVSLPLPLALAGAYGGWYVLQDSFGSSDNFFEGTFITTKNPEDIAEFYQAEDLLRIIAIHPILFNLLMNKVDPDTSEPTEETKLLSLNETKMRVRLFGMEASFEIIEEEEEGPDGEMSVKSFIRHERFLDWAPFLNDLGVKILLWDQTWNYGFNRLEDGTTEVYHRGEKFYGPWIVRLIIFFHQHYVLWACKDYINGDAFGTDDLDKQQEQLACIPLHVFRDFVGKLRAEKEKKIEAQRKEPMQNHASIAEEEATLEKLKSLELQSSSISVARRPIAKSSSTSSGRAVASAKIVVGDKGTQEVMKSTMKDAKANRAVNDALHELISNPSLQWDNRQQKKSKDSLEKKQSKETQVDMATKGHVENA